MEEKIGEKEKWKKQRKYQGNKNLWKKRKLVQVKENLDRDIIKIIKVQKRGHKKKERKTIIKEREKGIENNIKRKRGNNHQFKKSKWK